MSTTVPVTVGMLESALLKAFPSADAEPWDRTGLVVGDVEEKVAKVAVALDPTVQAIREAADSGANVLVTHHPPFLDAPDDFQPGGSVAQHSGAGVWEAISRGVALMCFHTALDVSVAAQKMLPGMLGLCQVDVLDKIANDSQKGYGQVCKVQEEGLTLERLASKCSEVFGRAPRVWGNPDALVESVVTGTGSGSNLCSRCITEGIDCLVCGELKYHAALDLSCAGVSIIELGHDVSELPLTKPLIDALVDAGMKADQIVNIDQDRNWFIPNSNR